jgi:hypothetical protein
MKNSDVPISILSVRWILLVLIAAAMLSCSKKTGSNKEEGAQEQQETAKSHEVMIRWSSKPLTNKVAIMPIGEDREHCLIPDIVYKKLNDNTQEAMWIVIIKTEKGDFITHGQLQLPNSFGMIPKSWELDVLLDLETYGFVGLMTGDLHFALARKGAFIRPSGPVSGDLISNWLIIPIDQELPSTAGMH